MAVLLILLVVVALEVVAAGIVVAVARSQRARAHAAPHDWPAGRWDPWR